MNTVDVAAHGNGRVGEALGKLDDLLLRLEELGALARDARATLATIEEASAVAPPAHADQRSTAHDPLRAPLAPRVVRSVPEADSTPGGAATRGRLTRRQQEVLDLLSQGTSNRRISRRLAITEQTVKAHLHMIQHKLGAADRTEAVVIALNDGLVTPAPLPATARPPAPHRADRPPLTRAEHSVGLGSRAVAADRVTRASSPSR